LKYPKHSPHSPPFHHLPILLILLLPSPKKITQEEATKNSSPPSLSRPFLLLILLVPWELRKSPHPIHGLFILQELMRVENDLPSNGF
jgi:hypothetical protein